MLRQATISPLDVDAHECHAVGDLLKDAIEVGAASKVYRGQQDANCDSLMLGAVKSQVGAQCEFCGHAQIMKAVWSQRNGCYIPSVHLRTLNPHIELEVPIVLNSEAI